MRKAVVDILIDLAAKDKKIYVLVGDLGYSVWEKFQEKYPKRFINCGIAEQTMIGMAAGLALTGKKVYVYSIIPFLIFRPFEYIRNDICYQNLDVNLIGVGAGDRYKNLGSSHYTIEDVSIIKNLPNIKTIPKLRII